MTDPIEQYRAAILAADLTPPAEIIPDGKLHRFSSSGKPRDDSGWYVLHLDGIPAGAFGCWREGFTQQWCSKSPDTMTQSERDAHRQRMDAAQQQREADTAQRQQQAAQTAAARWSAATPATAHPYMTAKAVKPYGLKAEGEALLIPMRDAAGTLHSLQVIDPEGGKRFQPGGRVKGCYHAIGKPDGVLIVSEGYATGASIHKATGHAVAVAFNAGNLKAVAEALHQKYPDLMIVIASDDDWQTEGNPGKTKASEAAMAVGGTVVLPMFPLNRPQHATDFNDLHQLVGLPAVRACIEQALLGSVLISIEADDADNAAMEWPDPRPIEAELPAAPEFDAQVMLPKVLADFVLDEADRMPCAPDYVAAALAVAMGSVIGAKVALKPKRRDDWIVTPNLYGGVVGSPSAKKTPSVGTVMRFLDRLEAKETDALERQQKAYEVELAAFEAHEAAVKNAMKTAAKSKDGTDKMSVAMADLESLIPPVEPQPRRYKSNDATTEKLGDLLAHNDLGILVFRDELIGLLSSWDKEGREGDKAFYLEGWNGTGSFNIDRISRGSQYIKTLCLSVFGGIQPDLLERYLADIANRMDNDGRIQRFQVLVYPDPVAWEWRDRYPVKGAREAVRDLFERLAYFDPLQDGASPADDFVKLPHLRFDDDAQELFVEWSTHLHRELIANEQNPLVAQHLGKFEKLFCALALILHLAEGRVGDVTLDSAMRAAAWCDYLEGHARRIYAMVDVAKVNTARMLSRRIMEGKLQNGFTARDVWKKGWSGIKITADAEVALSVLEEFGWLLAQEPETNGRPTTRYLINPKCEVAP